MAGRRRTKTVEQSIADTDEPDTRLRKDLTWWNLTVFEWNAKHFCDHVGR